VQQYCPILAEAAGSIGDVQVRHRGTIGGSLAHFDPAADYPPVCLALGARFHLVGLREERIVPVDDFFQSYMTTAIAPNEMLTEVRVPMLPAGTGSTYAKHQRIEGGFAIVGVAAVLTVQGGRCESVAVGIAGGGVIPFLLQGIKSRCQGKSIDQQFIAEVAEAAYAAAAEPSSELHADAVYKRAMVRVFTQRALQSAMKRAAR
jgi:carbon-monoxide dehydrogenase medium subunit